MRGDPLRFVRRVFRRRAAQASWSLTLLVCVEEDDALLRPSVTIQGPPLRRARVRIELLDRRGVLHPLAEAPVEIGSEVLLPPASPPDGVSAEEAAGWCWKVVLVDRHGERAQWFTRLGAADRLNPEAELAHGL